MENIRNNSDEGDHNDNIILLSTTGNFPAKNKSHSHNKSKKTEITSYSHNYGDDLRISRILRRLSSTNDHRLATDLCRKLENISHHKDNIHYIRRTIDFLTDSIVTIMRKCPFECLNILSNILGQFGYIARQDFQTFKCIIFKSYDNLPNIRIYLMRALLTLIRYDKKTYDLEKYSNELFHHLKCYLENSNIVDDFIAVTDCILELSKCYNRTFDKHFTDIVDILVGWHLQVDQTSQFKTYCSGILQKLSPNFINNIEFTFGLLNQFLEDVIIYGTETENTTETQRVRAVLNFVGALNAVLKCLIKEKQILAYKAGDQLFYEAVQIINIMANLNLKRSHNNDAILIFNEFFILILKCVDVTRQINLHNIIKLIENQDKYMEHFHNSSICSLLLLILTTIREFQTAIPVAFIEYLTSKNASNLYMLKFSKHFEIYKLYLQIYQEILIITNVPLLQEAYKNILKDVNIAIKVILQIKNNEYEEEEEYNPKQAEYVINFYIAALSVLAAQSSSIIAMYSLQPSILELVIEVFQVSDVQLWSKKPDIYRSLLKFLVVHCTKNNNYLLSSNLLPGRYYGKLSFDADSPTCEHFSHILNFHTEFLSHNMNNISIQIFELISNWLNGIILQCGEYTNIFQMNTVFQKIVRQLPMISINYSHLQLPTATCLNSLILYHRYLDIETLQAIYQACCIHMCSTNSTIRSKYSEIFGKLPLSITLRSRSETSKWFSETKSKLIELKQHMISLNIRDQFFQIFFQHINFELKSEFCTNILTNIFTKCWIPDKSDSLKFHQNILNNLPLLINWIQSEVAHYCITNKLRTPLGKPQETFMKIELLIKDFARILAAKEYNTVNNVTTLLANQKHANILLGFLEYLEKVIYNASDGTAFSLLPPEKTARVFFAINTLTCNEWFKRIRNAVNIIALYCSEPEMVIRYSEEILKHFLSKIKTNDPTFNHCLILFVIALLNTSDSESLNGLYILMKFSMGKRYMWIKYAAEQAAGYFENAAEGYKSILNHNSDMMNYDRNINEFINTQLVECLYMTQQWNELRHIINDENYSSSMVLSTINIEEIISSDQIVGKSLQNLSRWDHFDEEHLKSNFSYQRLMLITEKTLVSNILSTRKKNQIDYCKMIVESGIEEAFRTGSMEHFNNLVILNNVVQHIFSEEKSMNSTSQYNIDKSIGLTALMKIKKWADYFSSSNYYNKFICNYEDLHLNIVSLCRKKNNFKLAQIELLDYFHQKSITNVLGQDLFKMSDNIYSNLVSLSDYSDYEIRGLRETAKLLYDQNSETGIQLIACCIIKILTDPQKVDNFSEKYARMLLNLSCWLSQNPELLTTVNESSPLKKLVLILPELSVNMNNDVISVIPQSDMVIGKLIQVSVKQCPSLPKVWSALGNWYYRWGRKIIEANSGMNAAGLSVKDIEKIKEIIKNASEDDLDEIVDILNNHQVFADDEEIDPNEHSTSDIIEKHLRTVKILKIVPSQIITIIIDIWRQAHKSKSMFYEMAADAYFKYLNLAVEDGKCATITATLRLLRLVVKHAFGLQTVLEDGLSSTPTRPWKAIIPQLFSRLNHHEQYVRKRVSELLCRVAEDSPHLIIFPAVVGAAQKSKHNYLNCDIIEDGLKIEENKTAPLTLCFNSLLDILSTQTPETVKQVQVLESELRRISLLWDEFWFYSLGQLYNKYIEVFNAFENDVRKTTSDEKLLLLHEKHSNLVEHVVNDMKRIQSFTSRTPETNNEKEFQEKYTKFIELAIENLKNKVLNIKKPNDTWQIVKNIYYFFQQKIQKNVQTSFKMFDISPILAEFKNTSISMPGVETSDRTPVYIRSVDNAVNILPTKTKPKKIALYGSDGKKYTYLFKGLEDLHLDERIMQFLSISNSMMTKSIDGATYRAHHYSVIPLGPQSGLISWVDEMTPLFALYKKWQQHESTKPQKSDKVYVVLRPSEMFFAKLSPLLAKQKIKTSDSRKTWPMSILRQVLEELTTETPKELLAKELWCHSVNAADWRRSIKTYSRSVAVMSVIGYVIGLGDRHLDNILIKLSTGNIVHIDYNVCFEKGKTLGVPERVPFRMTQNIKEALGITGIEGIFRLSCEHVLKTLRKEREILLTLLEAFVYDPLVDWAVSDYSTNNSLNCNLITKSMAAQIDGNDIPTLANVTKNLDIANKDPGNSLGERLKLKKKITNDDSRKSLKNRIADIRPEWIQYKNDLGVLFQNILRAINTLEEKRFKIQETENCRDLLSKQLSIVQEVETLGTAMESHSLNTISQRYATYIKSNHELNEAKNILVRKFNEYKNQNMIYFNMTSINFTALWNYRLPLKINNEFELCKELFKNSTDNTFYDQAIKTKNILDLKINQQVEITAAALEYLEQYLCIIRLYPVTFLQRHRSVLYQECLQILISNPLNYQNTINKIEQYELNEKLNDNESQNAVIQYSCELQKIWTTAEMELQETSNLYHNISLQDLKKKTEDSCQAIYLFNTSPSCTKAILAGFLSNVVGMVADLIKYEKTCMNLINDPYQYSPNATDTLDEQLMFLRQFEEMSKLLYSVTNNSCGKSSEVFKYLCLAGESLRKLQSYLTTEIVIKIVALAMSEVLEIQHSFQVIVQIENDFNFEKILYDLSQNCNMESIIHIIQDIIQRMQKTPGIKEVLDSIDEIFQHCKNVFLSCIKVFNELKEQFRFGETDHQSMAKEILTQTINSPEIIQQQFDIIKTHTLIQLITVSSNLSKSLIINDLNCVYDMSIFQKIISSSINIIESDIFLGLGSYLAAIFESEILTGLAIESIDNSEMLTCEKLLFTTIQSNISASVFSVPIYSRAQSLSKKFIAAIQEKTSNENTAAHMQVQTNIIQHLRMICSLHTWINQNIVTIDPAYQHIFHKSLIIQNLQLSLQNIELTQSAIENIIKELNDIRHTFEQRIKRVVDINISVPGLKQSYIDCIDSNNKHIEYFSSIIATITSNINAILSYEFMKFNTNIMDEEFLMLVNEFYKRWQNHESIIEMISKAEMGIVELLNPEGSIDQQWLNNISGLLDEMTDNVQSKIAYLEKDINIEHDSLVESAGNLRLMLDQESRTDLRYLIKFLFKTDNGHQKPFIEQKQFQANYKHFIGQLCELHVKLLNRDFTKENCQSIGLLIGALQSELNEIYDVIFDLTSRCVESNDNWNKDKFEQHSGTPIRKKVNQPEQKRNAYAVSVWRRIRMKLEGRDPDPNRRKTISDQVDWMIREATNPDNLAVLYEGWTPWV